VRRRDALCLSFTQLGKKDAGRKRMGERGRDGPHFENDLVTVRGRQHDYWKAANLETGWEEIRTRADKGKKSILKESPVHGKRRKEQGT